MRRRPTLVVDEVGAVLVEAALHGAELQALVPQRLAGEIGDATPLTVGVPLASVPRLGGRPLRALAAAEIASSPRLALAFAFADVSGRPALRGGARVPTPGGGPTRLSPHIARPGLPLAHPARIGAGPGLPLALPARRSGRHAGAPLTDQVRVGAMQGGERLLGAGGTEAMGGAHALLEVADLLTGEVAVGVGFAGRGGRAAPVVGAAEAREDHRQRGEAH